MPIRPGLPAAAPEIVAVVKRMLDGVRDGELAPASAEPDKKTKCLR